LIAGWARRGNSSYAAIDLDLFGRRLVGESSMLDRRYCLIAVSLIGLALVIPAQAQDKYPSRPIKLLVPFPAGGPVDVMGRLIAQRLSSTLGGDGGPGRLYAAAGERGHDGDRPGALQQCRL
jgi:hypothetical protein